MSPGWFMTGRIYSDYDLEYLLINHQLSHTEHDTPTQVTISSST